MTEQDRAGRARANIARHLNQSYPDALLFLAHHAADRPTPPPHRSWTSTTAACICR